MCIQRPYDLVSSTAIFLEHEYLLRRDSGSKVVLEEVLAPICEVN